MKVEVDNLILEYGKINSIDFGYGGYQGVQIGFTIDVGGKGWGSTKFYAGGWATEPSKDANWTYDSRIKDIGEVAWQIVTLLKKAKKDRLQQLIGVPIKAYFEPQGGTRLAGKLHHIEIFEDVI